VNSEYQQLPVLDGDLSPFNHLYINTKQSLMNVEQAIEEFFVAKVDNASIDYTFDKSNFCFNGRMFGRNECCTFVVALYYVPLAYPSANDSNNNYSSQQLQSIQETNNEIKVVMEIRRMSGDGFVFNDFFTLFSKEMNEKRIIITSEDITTPESSTNLSLMSFDWNCLDIDPNELDQCIKLESSPDGIYEDLDLSTSSEPTTESKIKEWFNSITDRNCYGEYISHCTVQWLEMIEAEKKT